MNKEPKHLPYSLPDTAASCETGSIYKTVLDAVHKYLPAGASILDVGCGRGELMKMLAEDGYEVSGCDADEKCVKLSGRYGKVQQLDIEDIRLENMAEKYDCVVMSHVLEHVENPRETLTRIANLTKDLLIISVPNPYYSPFILKALLRTDIKYVNPRHLYCWDWSHFKTFAEMGCGMKVLDYFYDSVALPIPYRIRSLMGDMGLLKPLEYGLLRKLFPRFCSSITAVLGKDPNRQETATFSPGS